MEFVTLFGIPGTEKRDIYYFNYYVPTAMPSDSIINAGVFTDDTTSGSHVYSWNTNFLNALHLVKIEPGMAIKLKEINNVTPEGFSTPIGALYIYEVVSSVANASINGISNSIDKVSKTQVLTQQEYNNLAIKDDNTVYLIHDSTSIIGRYLGEYAYPL